MFFRALLASPAVRPTSSTYTIVNGGMYLAFGLLLIAWPGAVQALLLDGPFVGHEADLVRVAGMTLAIIGWFYVIGGLSGSRQFVAATVVDRMLVPFVLVPLALRGTFPHVLLLFAIVDPTLAVGALGLMSREQAELVRSAS